MVPWLFSHRVIACSSNYWNFIIIFTGQRYKFMVKSFNSRGGKESAVDIGWWWENIDVLVCLFSANNFINYIVSGLFIVRSAGFINSHNADFVLLGVFVIFELDIWDLFMKTYKIFYYCLLFSPKIIWIHNQFWWSRKLRFCIYCF